MKTNRRNAFLGAALGTFIFTHTASQAQTSTWAGGVASLANGAWGTGTNWNAGVPDSATSIALLTKDWTGTGPTFTLGADRTLNGLEYEDTGTGTDVVGAINATNKITLAGTTPYVATRNSFTFNNVLAGTAGLRKLGPVTLTLTGTNTISGDLNVDAGVVATGSAAALGTMAIKFTSGDTGRVAFGGGFTYANNVTVDSGVTGTTGVGLINHTAAGGVATLNGTITLSGLTGVGGLIFGSNTVGQELRLNGAINETSVGIGLSQRDGRVIYAGGGTASGGFVVTGTAIIGANNGMPQGLTPQLAGSGSATLDLNGFSQTLAALNIGNSTNAFTSTVNLGAGALTLNGDITSLSATTQNITHFINATTGSGSLNVGATNRTITLPDTLALDDLLITGANINGAGGVTKAGAGALTLKNVAVAGPLTINAGTLATGRYTEPAAVSVTAGSLAFGSGATTLRMKAGPGGDLISTGTLTTAGTTTVNLSQVGGLIPNGTYPLINYTGTSPGLAGFTLSPLGHTVSSLIDTTIGATTTIALKVDGNDSVVWDGTISGLWQVGATGNWKLLSNLATPADYIESDNVIFNDSPVTASVSIPSNVSPSGVTFNNTTLTPYTLSGAGGIIGTTGLTKTANGLLTINTPNAYTGATTINSGSVIANFTSGTAVPFTAIPSASTISVALNASLTLRHDGGTFALNNPTLTGAGTVTIDPGFITAGNRDLADVTWDASTFTGPLNLAPTTGTMRIAVNNTADIGSGPVTVATGGQLFVNAANLTIPNNLTITGTGYSETAGVLGAIRSSNPTTFTGTITVSGAAKIGALGATAIVTNTLSGGDLTFGGSNNNSSEILAITGDASGLTSLTVNDGTATGNANNIVVDIGNGTNTGIIGTVPVTLKADGFKSAIIRYARADGHTLVPNTITSAPTVAANVVRNYIDLDCTGTGFNDNGATLTLGDAAPASGGTVRVGQSRANALATLSGTLTGERLWVASGQNNATLTLGSTAVLKFNAFNLSESANNSATVNHPAGAKVEVVGQLRVSHYGTNTSVYNMADGTLTMTGDSPNASPSTPASGGNGTYGDNNLNTLNPQQIVGGGIYLGNDGTGVFNHTGGTVTTNWIVLDNRGASGAGTNMPDGIDRYNLSGTSILNLRSNWGLIGRNDGSYDVSLGGGTIKVDNTGFGTGTGPDITVPIDAILSTVASTITTLDTNAAGNPLNAFTLSKNVNGTGTLALTGGGTVNLSSTWNQNIAANLSSSSTTKLDKLGTGTTTLTGNMSAFTGTVKVSNGRLNVPATLNTSVTVEAAGTLSGEISLVSLTLNDGTLLFDPTTGGSLSATSLVLNGNSLLDVSAAPGVGTFPALTFGSVSGGGTLAVTNAGDYRVAPIVSPTSNSPITVTFAAGAALTWTGTANSTWKIAGDLPTESNWKNITPSADLFYSGDSVTFPEGGTNPLVTLVGLLAPAGVSVTAETTAYTLTSTSGNLITGTTGLTKSGGSTLTLVGANAYSGITSISGGTISIATDSLGSGAPGNSIALSGGGKLSYTGAVAADLGSNRSIAVGTGGGILEHNNAAAAAITISGALSGSEALTIQSAAAGGGTVALTGSNAAYTGAITVKSLSTGQPTLRIDNTAAAPGGGSITLNYLPNGAASSYSTLSLLGGTTLAAATTINMTSALTSPAPPATVSLRSQIITTGNVTINGPITLSGDSIIQTVPPAGSTLTLNGDITEASSGSFKESPLQAYSNVLFLRGVGTNIVNGQINLPSAGSTVSVTDGATTIINSTGNDFKSAQAAYGTIRIGATNAIPTTARLVVGQAGNQACTLDLNGFDQTVSGLEWQATSAATTKGVSNTHPTATSTFTINQLAAPAANFSGTFTGAINLIKDGPATTTLSTALSTFTGNVTVEEGQLTVAAGHNDTNANSALGVTNVATRNVTVKNAATLAFTGNDNLGNATSAPILPIIVETGGVLTSAGFNTMGPITLNGGTMTGTAGANANFQAYRLFGTVTAGGMAASAMTASGTNSGYHLHSTTAFDVANATLDANADLTVSAPLINQSGTQSGAAGNLVKDGLGTMVLTGANTYTGNTTVNAGTLALADGAQLRFAIGATSGTNNALSGSGTVTLEGDFAIDLTAAAALTAGTWLLENVTSLGAYGSNFQVVDTAGLPWANTGDIWTKDGGAGKTWTFSEATGTLSVAVVAVGGYDAWATQIPNAADRDRTDDPDGDGFNNGQEFLFGTSPNVGNGALVTSQKSGGNLVMQWLQREGGAGYLLQESTTLGTGSWSTSVVVPGLGDQTGVPTDYDRYTATIVIGANKKFFRIQGTEN